MNSSNISLVITGILAGFLFLFLGTGFFFFIKRLFERLPIAFNVAVIGFPKSGKTILITSLFSEIFKDRFFSSRVIVKGKATIERVNRDMELLDLGKSLGPTTDQDLFAYRFDYKKRQFIPFTYKIEIGDFPGEDSQDFVEHSGEWLHESAFFKWVMEADAFIFVIDLAKVITDTPDNQYRAMITKAIRAAWQNIVDYHYEGKKRLKAKPIILVFSKADLLIYKFNYINKHETTEAKIDKINEQILRLGFGKNLPNIIQINENKFKEIFNTIEADYKDIAQYLESQTFNFDIFFVSPFLRVGDEGLGISSLLKKILPK